MENNKKETAEEILEQLINETSKPQKQEKEQLINETSKPQKQEKEQPKLQKDEWIFVNIPKNVIVAESQKSVYINLGDFKRMSFWLSKKMIKKANIYDFLEVYTININVNNTFIVETDDEKVEMNAARFVARLSLNPTILMYNYEFVEVVKLFISQAAKKLYK